MTISRRGFLKTGLAGALLGFSPSILRLAVPQAVAADLGDYKAAVCVYLHGGNDGNNCVVSLGEEAYREYVIARGKLALASQSLRPVQATTTQQPFGFHPNLSGLSDLFRRNKLAVVANVGTLCRPVTREQYLAGSVTLPYSLFSHSDQSKQWQTAKARDNTGQLYGWGGQVADSLRIMNGAAMYPSVTSVAGAHLYCDGRLTKPSAVDPRNKNGLYGFYGTVSSQARFEAMQNVARTHSQNSLINASADASARMFDEIAVLNDAYASHPGVNTAFPGTSIGSQLLRVAELIQARDSFGLGRQLFFVSLGGFDTHTNQLAEQAKVLSQLDAALTGFYQATEELGVASQVVTFTMSEFGRTVSPGNGGSDHGWGSHHFVMGGSVRGGDIYGQFPSMKLGGSNDAGELGRLIPSTSVDQYAASIARWLGVTENDIVNIFPDLRNFQQQGLAFV